MNALQIKIARMALLAVCSAALTAPVAVLAQDTPPPPPAQDANGPAAPGGHHGHGGGGDRAAEMKEHESKQLEMLTKHLNLTDAQQTQVKQIYADSDAKIAALFADESTSMQDKRPKMQGLMQDRMTAVRNVMSPEQQPKYDEFIAKEKERMQENRGKGGHGGPGGMGGPGGGAPPPQQ